MKKQTLPAGEDARRTWRTINHYAPADADAFAAWVWRYAETGEEPPPDAVNADDWAATKAEVDRIEAARAAGRKGGAAGTGDSKARPGNRNASKTQAKTQPTRAHEDEDEDEDKNKNQNPEDRRTRAPARELPASRTSDSSGFGSLRTSDFYAWARIEKDPVSVALEVTGEGDEKRPVYGASLRDLVALRGKEEGTRIFIEECCTLQAEIRDGEEVRNRGAALVSRLKQAAARRLNDRSEANPSPRAEAAPVVPGVPPGWRPPVDNAPANPEAVETFGNIVSGLVSKKRCADA